MEIQSKNPEDALSESNSTSTIVSRVRPVSVRFHVSINHQINISNHNNLTFTKSSTMSGKLLLSKSSQSYTNANADLQTTPTNKRPPRTLPAARTREWAWPTSSLVPSRIPSTRSSVATTRSQRARPRIRMTLRARASLAALSRARTTRLYVILL